MYFIIVATKRYIVGDIKISPQAFFMASRSTVTGKEAMASHRAMFLAARDRALGKEAMAYRRVEFIAAGSQTITWAVFEAAMAEWVVDLEAAKVAQKERKRQKAVKKRESLHGKKEEAARRTEESSAKMEAWWAAADKAGRERHHLANMP